MYGVFPDVLFVLIALPPSGRCHIHDYSTDVEQRSEPDSVEAKRDSKRLIRWMNGWIIYPVKLGVRVSSTPSSWV